MMNVFQKLAPIKARFLPGLLAVFLVSFSMDALAQTDLNARINRLENELQTLNRAVYRGEVPSEVTITRTDSVAPNNARSAAQAEIRIQQLEQEIQTLRGSIEQVTFENQSLRRELERFKGDLELRIQDLEAGKAVGHAAVNAPRGAMGFTTRNPDINPQDVIVREPPQPLRANDDAQPSAGQGFVWNSNSQAVSGGLSEDSATATYESAFALLRNSDYERAQSEFEAFLRNYPDHVLAGNAKYWLAETHYVRGNFEASARLFAQGYQEFPKGSKAADNLLKLGMSLAALGKNEDACIALAQIEDAGFSNAPEILRRAQQEKSRIGC